MSKRYGYARVSVQDQDLEQQMSALQQAGCEKIYTDHGLSDSQVDHPELTRLLKILKPGDTLVTWRLDRLGRSLKHLINLVEQFKEDQIHFISISENIDTSSAEGRLLLHLMTSLADFERALSSERTRAGMAVARASGKQLGKPRSLTPQQQEEALQALSRDMTVKEVAQRYGVHPRTIQRLRDASMLH